MNFFIVIIANSLLAGQPGAIIVTGPAMSLEACEAVAHAPGDDGNSTYTCLTAEQASELVGTQHECYHAEKPPALQLSDQLFGQSSIAARCKK
jgi:hypothetical protein